MMVHLASLLPLLVVCITTNHITGLDVQNSNSTAENRGNTLEDDVIISGRYHDAHVVSHHGNRRRRTNNNNNKKVVQGSNIMNNAQAQRQAEEHIQTYFNNILQLQNQYGSNIVTVQDATEMYPILSSDNNDIVNDCPFEYIPWQFQHGQNANVNNQNTKNSDGASSSRSGPCYTPIVTIYDAISNAWPPPPQASSTQQQSQQQTNNNPLPEVLLLSGLDYSYKSMDILGPSSIIESIKLLLECAHCESLSPWIVMNVTTTTSSASSRKDNNNTQTNSAIECRQKLSNKGINDETRKWLARLVSTRKIIAVPMVNVVGYYERLVAEIIQMQGQTTTTEEEGGQQQDTYNNIGGGEECDFPFPFHYKESTTTNNAAKDATQTKCMSTYPARIMNELFRTHSFQLGVSFHGTESMYQSMDISSLIEVPSWTPPPPPNDNNKKQENNDINEEEEDSARLITNDEKAMLDISHAYSKFAGLNKHLPYEVRTSHTPAGDENLGCNGVIFEHWAFSGGFVRNGNKGNYYNELWMEQCSCSDTDNVENNKNSNVCSYPSEQTAMYDGSSLRAFVARVVSPPPSEEYYNSNMVSQLPGFDPSYHDEEYSQQQQQQFNTALHDPSPLGNNVRMAILSTELVEPYTAIRSIGGVQLADDDIIPLLPRPPTECTKTRSMIIPESSKLHNITVSWTVGGSITIAETAIMYGKWDVLDTKIFDCVTQPTKNELDAFFTILRDFEVIEGETAEEMEEDVSFTPVQSGTTRWHDHSSSSIIGNNDEMPSIIEIAPETTFSVTLDLSHYKVGDVIAVYSLARADQDWVFGQNNNDESPSSFMAQSNLVNARTNPDFSSPSGIQGRLDWFSVPVTIEIGPQPGFFEGNDPTETSVRISDEGYERIQEDELGLMAYSLVMAVLVLFVTVVCVFCREERDGTDICSVWSERRQINKQRIKMDEFFYNESLELTQQYQT